MLSLAASSLMNSVNEASIDFVSSMASPVNSLAFTLSYFFPFSVSGSGRSKILDISKRREIDVDALRVQKSRQFVYAASLFTLGKLAFIHIVI